jgi:D-glycero-D-manno-heptose 1,7-bisphosphate phosphatase
MKRKAIFLDRDGVLDELVFHSDTGGWEAPRDATEIVLRPGVPDALRSAAEAGWMIFVVSNQPDVAKGRTTREALAGAHDALVRQLGGAPVTDFFYCFHRSEDRCECRKPLPFFVQEAAKQYDIDLRQSWFAGDMDTDIECGARAGCKTALLEYEHSSSRRGKQRADLVCRDLNHFVRTLLERKSDHAAAQEPQD